MNYNKIDIDEIMELIRQEIVSRKKQQKNKLQKIKIDQNIMNNNCSETKIWKIIKSIQKKLQYSPIYPIIYRISYKLKKIIPKYKNNS